VPYRLLEPVRELSHGDVNSGNLIVQGDNLHALKALLPRYAGKVKCIYIDPPYNTGNENWIYNDNVNSPEIKKWLNEVVGKEGEDLSRHDKWLCMMYPRLVLLRNFLSEDGAIFISIDDSEVASLRILLDEIFGKSNFLANLLWKKKTNGNNMGHIPPVHDFIICYAKNAEFIDFPGYTLSQSYIEKNYSNSDNDPRGLWTTMDLSANHKGPYFLITNPITGKEYFPPKGRYWVFNEEEANKRIIDGRIIFGKTGKSSPVQRVFLSEREKRRKAETWWDGCALNSDGMKELREIFGRKIFDHPKPSELLKSIIEFSTHKDSIIFDSFSGSGTTGHAVLKQNKEDGGSRKFILVEMEHSISVEVTAERVRRVCEGYENTKGEKIEGFGAGFQFCKLSEKPLFDNAGAIRQDVTFEQLAEFVWFAETGVGMTNKTRSVLIGVHEGRAIYLLYNGILKDRSVNGGNVLTSPVLADLPKHDGPKVIYAAACRLGAARLVREQVVFKQTPYALDF